MDIVEILMELIDEDTDQPRYQFDEEALQELMKSIDEIGLLSPIKVRTTGDGRYKIIYGNRRYKASQMLSRRTIPCIVSTVTDEMEIYLEQIAENLTREGFSPIEEAEAFNKLLNDPKFRSSTKYLSGKLGKPEAYIKNKCELLKFSNAVKRLIVSGTEIRKDKLTEDQLLPLKDLPMEHRDPLALIVARDELPVSDVKKIARLFKDKTISAGTKDKLLFKTGSGLIETWSTYEQNKAERAKPAAEPKAKSSAKAASAEESTGQALTSTSAVAEKSAGQAATGTSALAGESAALAATGTSASAGPAATGTSTSELAGESARALLDVQHTVPIEAQLQTLLTVLSNQQALSPGIFQSIADSAPSEREALASDVKKIIASLEQQLTEWETVLHIATGATGSPLPHTK